VFQGIYSVTKAAVINMTKVFAKECAAFGIRCNALLPGLTDTKFASALVKNEHPENALAQIPLKRVADPAKWPVRCCTWPAMRRGYHCRRIAECGKRLLS
jgi:NAD(P)-dependent dehydrogenase (short-subunit alcohol dehydrogenase family)